MAATLKRTIGLVVAFVLIFALGVCVGRYRRSLSPTSGSVNHIKFLIRSNGEVSVSPEKGDEIKWFAEAYDTSGNFKPHNASVKFDNSPCDSTDKTGEVHTCTINNPLTRTYYYSCKTFGDKRDCADPHVGPGTGTSRNGYVTVSGLPTSEVKGDRIVNISCLKDSSGKPAVSVDPITNLLPTESIQWSGAPIGEFNFEVTLAGKPTESACTIDQAGKYKSLNFGPGNVCYATGITAGGKYPYTIKITGGDCQNTTVTGQPEIDAAQSF